MGSSSSSKAETGASARPATESKRGDAASDVPKLYNPDKVVVTRDTSLTDREQLATMQMMDVLRADSMAKAMWHAEHQLEAQDNTGIPYVYKRLELPLDDEGYVVTCAPDDPDAIRSFYDK